MSIISGSDRLQMVIPAALLNSNGGGLGCSVLCDEDPERPPSQVPRSNMRMESR